MNGHETPDRRTGSPETDVVVAGSGAAGLVAALCAAEGGARVVLLESSPLIGGTTALSGGRVWIPANHTPANAGDTVEAAITYLSQIFDTSYLEMIRTFAERAPEMGRVVEALTTYRFKACPNYPDYFPDLEGATHGGRCLDMELVTFNQMQGPVELIRHAPGYLPLTHAEWEKWRYPANFDSALLQTRMQSGVRTGGPALTAALLDGLVRAGVRVLVSHRLTGVTQDDGGAVCAATVDGPEGEMTIQSSAVILATGGFDWDEKQWHESLPSALRVSTASPSDLGDALVIARDVGAQVDNLAEGWWMPAIQIPGETVDGQPYARCVIRERGTPRQIIVDRTGHRFVNESVPYNEFGKAMHQETGDGGRPDREAFIVFDEGFHRRYPLPGLPPGVPLPAWVATAPTLTELAGIIGVDPAELEGTVERWNGFCRDGSDLDFHRGENAYDRYYGDPWSPNSPNLGPIDEPPYYAVQILAGTIGTKGGPVTTPAGQVVGGAGEPIAGLYAVGNAAAFWTGDGYPGPGATLSLGMTFGMLAGRHSASAATRAK